MSIPLIDKKRFEQTIDGKKVELFVLKNASGTVAEITNYGARVVTLWVAGKNGEFEDVVLGYDSLQQYLDSKEVYYGSVIGRYANRIAKGKFTLNGKEYTLAVNNGVNNLHGGKNGYNNVVWDAIQIDDQTLELRYFSPDGEEGFPGNMEIKHTYTLTDENELKVEYWASTDQTTHANFTHHSFFNLHGAGNGSINDHVVTINADKFTPVDEALIPTGELRAVEGTPMDFRSPMTVGSRIDEQYEQLLIGQGYDHNYVLNKNGQTLSIAAKVESTKTGISMEVLTNEPGMQYYGGNWMNGESIGKGGKAYNYREALCFETQHFPDSPNKPQFPSTVLNPGEEYYSACVYRFSVEN